MTFLKAIAGLLLTIVYSCDAQFLTPDQLREQHDIGFGARTHYEMSGSRLTDMFRRVNPDYLFRGFFPFWSVVLIAFALVFLLIAVIGLIGYLMGCRRPTPEELMAKEFEQIPTDDEYLLANEEQNGKVDLSNGYFPSSNFNGRQDPMERARIGFSNEDMV